MGKKDKGKNKELEDERAQQLVALQNRLEEVENKLAHERVVVEQLRAINADQSKQLVQSEALVKSEAEKHAAEMWLLYDETTTAKESASHDNGVLKEKVRQLEAEVEGLRVLEDENQRLRDRVGALMSEVDKSSKDHANETHRLKKEVFNLRMQLEQTFRKAMQELDAEYKQRALSNLDNESKNALQANAKLQAELHMQTQGIEALMTKYKAMETEYTKLKIDYEVLQNGTAIQETRIGGLRRANLVASSQLEELQLGAVGQGKAKIKELTEALERCEAKLADATDDAGKWKTRYGQLERNMALTIKRMRDAQRRRERALRDKKMGTSKARPTKPKSVIDGGPLPPHPLEGYGFPSIGVEQSVEAFDAYADILAIWNSNFPQQRGHGAGGGKGAGGGRARGMGGGHAKSTPMLPRRVRQRGLEGADRDTSLPKALLPRDARTLARSLRAPPPSSSRDRVGMGMGGSGRSGGASRASSIPHDDVGNLDAGLDDILRRSKRRDGGMPRRTSARSAGSGRGMA